MQWINLKLENFDILFSLRSHNLFYPLKLVSIIIDPIELFWVGTRCLFFVQSILVINVFEKNDMNNIHEKGQWA